MTIQRLSLFIAATLLSSVAILHTASVALPGLAPVATVAPQGIYA